MNQRRLRPRPRQGYSSRRSARVSSCVFGCLLGFLPASAQTLSDAQVERIDGLVEDHMRQGQVPGLALAIVEKGVPLAVRTYGLASLEHMNPIERSSVFELASLTKHMTAIAFLEQVEERRVRLEDRLSSFVPDSPEGWAEIRVGQLLSHMAGLAHRFEEKPHGSFLLDYSTDRMLASARATPMLSRPGEDWEYSDQGYFLAGYVLEQVTGRRFADLLQQRFFRPLGMERTGILDQAKIIEGRVDGYTVRDGKVENDRRVWQFGLTSHFGVVSTIDDLVKWERALWDSRRPGGLLSHTAVENSWQIQRAFDSASEACEAFGYARGWFVRRVGGVTYTDHGGFTGNFYLRSPDTGLAVIVLTNREYGAGLPPSELAWSVAALIDPTLERAKTAC